MSLIRLLILLLCLSSFTACPYSFVLDGGLGEKMIALQATTNQTHLLDAGMVFDTYLQRTFASMGLLAVKDPRYSLQCSILSSTRERITSPAQNASDRYRLNVSVLVKINDTTGKLMWQSTFTDYGTFAEGGQDEDALPAASTRLSQDIGRAVTALNL
jgi:hypothetical protein